MNKLTDAGDVTMEDRWELMFKNTRCDRCPGYFQSHELHMILKEGYCQIFWAGRMESGVDLWKVVPRDIRFSWNSLRPLDPSETGGRDPEEIVAQQFEPIPGERSVSLDLDREIERRCDGYYHIGPMRDGYVYVAFRRMRTGADHTDWQDYDWNPDPRTNGLRGV